MSSESMTLIVKGTCESELRTRFCPRRLMYSEMTGSLMTLDCDSTCIEIQLPIPFAQPTLRLPIASRSLMLPSCATLVAAGSVGGAAEGGVEEAWSLFLSLLSAAKEDEGK